jgi:hypothetical protein
VWHILVCIAADHRGGHVPQARPDRAQYEILVVLLFFLRIGKARTMPGHDRRHATMATASRSSLFGQAPIVAVALLIALALGRCDAVPTTIRQSAVQLPTHPDHLRGRVSSLCQVAAKWSLTGLVPALGPAGGLAVGGLVTLPRVRVSRLAVNGFWNYGHTNSQPAEGTNG